MAGGKIIGGPLSDGVINQLKIRSKILAKNARTDQDIMLLTSKTGWVKLSSGVNEGGSSKLAEEYVLIGGQKGKTGTDTYTNYSGQEGKGFRPMPGITSVQIRSINRFGTLKEATITFNCWDRAQLTKLEKLFMRPGFSALLEWGHSMYTKDGNEPYDKYVETVQTFFTPGQSKEKIYAEIERLKKGSAYNYDGILGLIKNFSWSFRPDGGYDCTTTVISIGEIMESLTIDVDTPSITDRNSTENEVGMIIPGTMLQDILATMKKSAMGSLWTDIQSKFPTFATKHVTVGGREGLDAGRMSIKEVKSGDKIDSTATEYFTYISLRSFCEILNTLIIVDNNNKNVIRLNTDIKPLDDDSSTIPSCRFRSYKFHTSSDPNVCILITDTTKNWSYDEVLLSALQKLKTGSTNEILNIYVNLNFLQKQASALFNKPKESRTLLNIMQPILTELNTVLGGINEFELHYEESEFTYYIVDRKVETSSGELSVKDRESVINITGLKSAVSKFDFTTKLSPALTTMIAISAQAGTTDVGIEADALLRWNEGLSDRIIKKKTVKTAAQLKADAAEAEAEKQNTDTQQDQRRKNINYALGQVYNEKIRRYDREAIQVARTQNEQFATEYVQNHKTEGNNAGPAGIIPFEVGIEMDGISGIKQGQAFTINEGIMPAKYDGVVGFIVTGIDHTISGNRWVTNLKAQTIILKGGGKSKDKDYVNKIEEDPETPGFTPKKKKSIPTPPIKVTRDMNTFEKATNAVIINLEGGYWDGGAISDSRYANSKETMLGIDRGQMNTTANEKKFWALVDANKKGWSWLYIPPDPLKTQLINLVIEIMKPNYQRYRDLYLDKEVKALVESDGRLFYNMVYAVWNGPGYFKGYSKILNDAYKNGSKTSDQLLNVFLEERIAGGAEAYRIGTKSKKKPEGGRLGKSGRSLNNQGGEKIKKAVGL